MAQLFIRNLDDLTVTKLKLRAKQHSCSLAAEIRTILREAMSASDDWTLQVEAVRALFEGRHLSDSSELIREDRER
jgi:plasmid stability protein